MIPTEFFQTSATVARDDLSLAATGRPEGQFATTETPGGNGGVMGFAAITAPGSPQRRGPGDGQPASGNLA